MEPMSENLRFIRNGFSLANGEGGFLRCVFDEAFGSLCDAFGSLCDAFGSLCEAFGSAVREEEVFMAITLH
jgi:hypothetical protein